MNLRALAPLLGAVILGVVVGVTAWVTGHTLNRAPEYPTESEVQQIRDLSDCDQLAGIRDSHAYEAMRAAGRDDTVGADRAAVLQGEAEIRLKGRGCNPDGTVRVPTKADG